MRVLVKLVLTVAFCGVLTFGEANPAAGTWKLDMEKSKLNGPIPSIVHDGFMTIDSQIFTGTNTARRGGRVPRSTGETGTQSVFKFDLSPNGRALTLTRPASDPGLKLVFERQ
jgi:hypothetical protein